METQKSRHAKGLINFKIVKIISEAHWIIGYDDLCRLQVHFLNICFSHLPQNTAKEKDPGILFVSLNGFRSSDAHSGFMVKERERF